MIGRIHVRPGTPAARSSVKVGKATRLVSRAGTNRAIARPRARPMSDVLCQAAVPCSPPPTRERSSTDQSALYATPSLLSAPCASADCPVIAVPRSMSTTDLSGCFVAQPVQSPKQGALAGLAHTNPAPRATEAPTATSDRRKRGSRPNLSQVADENPMHGGQNRTCG
jgi:hypothetical protein